MGPQKSLRLLLSHPITHWAQAHCLKITARALLALKANGAAMAAAYVSHPAHGLKTLAGQWGNLRYNRRVLLS